MGGAGLVLLYVVQCAIGGWVHCIPAERRTGAQGLLLAIMGSTIFMLAFFEKWLGIVSVDHNKLDWFRLLFVSLSFSTIRKLTECIGRPGSRCAWRYDGAEMVWSAGGGHEGSVCGVVMSVVGNIEFAIPSCVSSEADESIDVLFANLIYRDINNLPLSIERARSRIRCINDCAVCSNLAGLRAADRKKCVMPRRFFDLL